MGDKNKLDENNENNELNELDELDEKNEKDAFDNIISIINKTSDENQNNAEPDIVSENISVEISEENNEKYDKAENDGRIPDSRQGSKVPKFLQPYMYYIRIAGVLVIVSGFIALMLAVVNAVTFDIIERTSAKVREESILEIFTEADSIELFASESEKSNRSKISVKNIYEVKKGSEVIGYCVNVSSVGFGGEIDMMIGTDTNNEITGIKIVSMSETPGLGTKTSDENFTSQFKGLSGTIAVGENIDAVSGATISSKAVIDGVNAVLSLNLGQIQVPDVENADPSTDEIPEDVGDTDTVDTSVPDPETTEVSPEIETQSPETQPQETETQPPETEPDIPAVIAPVETIPPETEPPQTQPPETQPPETMPPETQPPETMPPETAPPETAPPETEPPETQPPETQPPETVPEETEPPVTEPEETDTDENDWRLW